MWYLLSLLHADDLGLCRKPQEDLKVIVGRFVEVSRRRGLKVNTDKSEVMVLLEEGLECDVHVDVARLEQVSELKYLGCVLDESCADALKCRRKVFSR